MRICPHCQTKNFDAYTHCEKCKSPLITNPFAPRLQNAQQENQGAQVNANGSNNLRRVIKVLLIISCVAEGIALLTSFVLWLLSLCMLGVTNGLVLNVSLAITAFSCLFMLFVSLVRTIIVLYITRDYNYNIAQGLKIKTSMKIVTLLCFSILAGILMLCDNDA